MQTIIANELKKLLDKKEVILIDVREIDEYRSEHIEGSHLIPLGEISIDKLPSKSKPIVFYCLSGKRSMAAVGKLLAQDPNIDVYSLEGGMISWRTEEFPTYSLHTSVLPISRQAELVLGILLLASLIGKRTHPALSTIVLLVAFVQIFAGIVGWSPLAYLLSKAPWNR